VEVTSGPLGQGFANGVGFALAQAMLSAQLGPGNPVEDHWVYGIVSDGDIMEGVAAEAASFAGHHRLGRIVYLWDDNEITIDGRTSITFSGEDVLERFEGYGWHVQSVDGRDHDGISKAIDEAKGDPRPSLIRVRTVIGYGAPNKQGKSSVHGAPLGEEELGLAKDNLRWPREPRFLVPEDVRTLWREVLQGKQGEYQAWKRREEAWRATHPEQARLLDAHLTRQVPADAGARLLAGADVTDATRKLSQAALQKVAAMVPALAGGSADLAESNLTEIKGGGSVAADHFGGRNVHFGIREHAMGAIANGMAYDGTHIPFVSTFLIFSDYMRPAIRLAALSRLQVIGVFTHDTIFLGEDGPTHQPVEQLTALRAIPNLHVVRPADGLEVALAWSHALERRDGPTALVLTRQKPAPVQRSVPFDATRAARGGYVVSDPAGAKATIVATGSEVGLAQAAAALLAAKGTPIRVVSMPCRECFLAQPESYRREVLPRGQRVAVVEAARGLEWWQLAGTDGLVLGIDRFGASAPEKVLAEEYGFTPPQVAERVSAWLAGA
jgi:transketolase